MYQRRHWETIKQHSGRILTYYELHRTSIRIPACMQISISPKPGVQTTYHRRGRGYFNFATILQSRVIDQLETEKQQLNLVCFVKIKRQVL